MWWPTLLHGVRSEMEGTLTPPGPLRLKLASNKAEAWERWERLWNVFATATSLSDKSEKQQVATLLHVLGEECVEIYSRFSWTDPADKNKIDPVLEKFSAYCKPLSATNFNRHLFLERKQQDGETADEFCGVLQSMAAGCDLGNRQDSWITTKLILGLRDAKVKEKLMQSDKPLDETLQIVRIAEASRQQVESIQQQPQVESVQQL